MLSNGFETNKYDKWFYVKGTQKEYIIVCLYIDDMLIFGKKNAIINTNKKIVDQ